MRKYLYRKLREYLDLYVRPGDRIAEISAKETAEPLKFQGHELLVLQSPSREIGQPRLNLEALAEFRADYVLLNGNIHYEADIQDFLGTLRLALLPSTRVIIMFYSTLWKPWLRLATALGVRRKRRRKIGSPTRICEISCSWPITNWCGRRASYSFPFTSRCSAIWRIGSWPRCLASVFSTCSISPWSGRSVFRRRIEASCRQSLWLFRRGMKPETSRPPFFAHRGWGRMTRLIFIEGNSTDNTWETICELKAKYQATHNIQIDRQEGKGKGDAVRKGFSLAKKEILMILDADLTVPPEELPRFYEALVAQKGEFINGSRLVYPMEKQAMRFFNLLGNKFFAVMFSFVLGQRFKDTLCGTKVLTRENYLKLAAHRKYFGEFDPFGDFDLIFGAARMALRIVEVPIHYRERTYGSTNIERWKHGFILLRMLRFAAVRIKFL